MCSICAQQGHKCNNKRFHPYSNNKPLIKRERVRENVGINERNDISDIMDHINSGTEIGCDLKRIFATTFPGSELISASPMKTGNRSTKIDFQIMVSKNGVIGEYSVEHKGTIKFSLIPNVSNPWKIGVQFFNGPINIYSIGMKYAQLWYDVYIGSGSLKEEFKIESEIPSFEEWFQGDAKVQGDPKTDFGK
jgi:hypothetical protein